MINELLEMPDELLYADDLNKVLKWKHEVKAYTNMVIHEIYNINHIHFQSNFDNVQNTTGSNLYVFRSLGALFLLKKGHVRHVRHVAN